MFVLNILSSEIKKEFVLRAIQSLSHLFSSQQKEKQKEKSKENLN